MPAHGKHPEWSAPSDYDGQDAEWRALNDQADKVASEAAARWYDSTLAERKAHTDAGLWTAKVLNMQCDILERFANHVAGW